MIRGQVVYSVMIWIQSPVPLPLSLSTYGNWDLKGWDHSYNKMKRMYSDITIVVGAVVYSGLSTYLSYSMISKLRGEQHYVKNRPIQAISEKKVKNRPIANLSSK